MIWDESEVLSAMLSDEAQPVSNTKRSVRGRNTVPIFLFNLLTFFKYFYKASCFSLQFDLYYTYLNDKNQVSDRNGNSRRTIVKYGAVIVAAGMSSRMGEFKPMLNLGSISIAQRIVATLQQAGVSRIVVVTGYNALALERHLGNNGIVFLRNENYETTQMFDSAKIGLEYMKEKCDRILFTPVDIPLFTAGTVSSIMSSESELAFPVCDGQRGHPIMISSSLVDGILDDCGEGGLQGALSRSGASEAEIIVDDLGILHDADTPEDYKTLLQYHNSQLVRPVLSVSLAKEKEFFDGKIAMLLSLIEETNSVRTACRRMQISYSSGWNLIHTLESQLSNPLVERSQGGAGSGRSSLTEYGRELLDIYNGYVDELRKIADKLYEKHFKDVF